MEALWTYILVVSSLTVATFGADSFYSFSVKDIQGNDVDLKKYDGTVTLVVNTASQCGFTEAHVKALKRLHDILSYGDKFTVLAFPSNDFGDQEPWEDKEIEEYIRGHFNAEFPVFAKRKIVGSEASPEWKFLAEQSTAPDWNFHKYLVGKDGKVIANWDANTSVENIFDTIKSVVDGQEIPEQTGDQKKSTETPHMGEKEEL